jgi:type IV pilus assembly protein PilZ
MVEQQDPNSIVNSDENNSATMSSSQDKDTAIASNNLNNQAKVISLAIKDLTVLYTAYMPFVNNGGLFIPTKKAFNIGDVLPLVITIIDEANKYSVQGKVIWITPASSHSKPPGIGVQFTGPSAAELSKKIQDLLLGYGKNNEPTNTM